MGGGVGVSDRIRSVPGPVSPPALVWKRPSVSVGICLFCELVRSCRTNQAGGFQLTVQTSCQANVVLHTLSSPLLCSPPGLEVLPGPHSTTALGLLVLERFLHGEGGEPLGGWALSGTSSPLFAVANSQINSAGVGVGGCFRSFISGRVVVSMELLMRL